MRATLCLSMLFAGALSGCASAPASRAPALVPPPAPIARPGGENAAWWFHAGAATAARSGTGRARARNLILFVGDGMSLPTVAAARMLAGQRAGAPGEETRLALEDLPYTALSRTYNTDRQTPDSAGTMTAMITGAKVRIGALSVAQDVERGACAPAASELASLLEIAESAGLSTGVATTARLTHATPAAGYAHASEREWEADGNLPEAARAAGCRDIARQFVEFDIGDGIDVAFGGGRRNFLPETAADPERPAERGRRKDGRDLVAEWQARHADGRYVWNAAGFGALDLRAPGPVLGLFEADHMQYAHDRARDAGGEPTLAEMTRSAIALLSRDPDGYVLVVEAGRIDHAHHAGNAFRALDETIAMDAAVRAAREATSEAETLVMVTADHAHTMHIVGYAQRGNPILGKVLGGSSEDESGTLARDALGLPYTTLGYANGPGYAGATLQQPAGPKRFPHQVREARPAGGRPDLSQVDTTDPDYLQESAMPFGSETHGGDDVGVWASGPGAEAVRGSVEQNVLFHWLLQAQPALVAHLCALGACEGGVPVRMPALATLRAAARPRDASR
jgi:alkaline phosphatase